MSASLSKITSVLITEAVVYINFIMYVFHPILSNPGSSPVRQFCSHFHQLLASICFMESGKSHEDLLHRLVLGLLPQSSRISCSIETDHSILLEIIIFLSLMTQSSLSPGSLPALLRIPFSSPLISSSAHFLKVPVLALG